MKRIRPGHRGGPKPTDRTASAHGGRSAAEPAGFEPIQLLELELAGSEVGVAGRQEDGRRYRWARVLVRLHGAPLGAVDLELQDSAIAPEAVTECAWRTLGAAIDEHLTYDGLAPGPRTGASLPRPAVPPRCVRERQAFSAGAPLASVVIASRERPESLATTLDDVLALKYPRFEVIVVDNAPETDATRRLVELRSADAANLRYVCEPLPGLAVAHNRGLEATHGEIVAFTDDDVLVDRFWLLELARAFDLADDVACVTGLILPTELETPAQLWLEEWVRLNKGYEPRLFDLGSNRPGGKLFPYAAGTFGSGANMAYRTEALRAVGGFDPAMGTGTRARGGDDLAGFFSVVAAGHTLAYQPAAIIRHAYRRDSESLRTLMYDYGAGLGAFLTKIVVDRPGRLLDIAWRVPFGAAHALRSRPSGRNRNSRALANGLAVRERLGMLAGPAGYLIERRRRRRSTRRADPDPGGWNRRGSRSRGLWRRGAETGADGGSAMSRDKAASRFGGTTRRLAAHVRTPVYQEGYALVLSAGLAAALGFLYWIIAARTYKADVVGLNSAAISTMMLVSGVAQLNLVGGLLSFVPGAGRSTWRLVGWSYAISLVVATLLALVFLAGVRVWAPKLAFLSSDDGFAFWFIASTMVWCIFSLQDAVLTGLRRAIWVPIDNTTFAVAKIGLLAAFATTFPRFGIFASWTLGVVLSVIVINAVLVRRLIPAHTRAPIESPEVATARLIGRFVAADYAGGVTWIAAITLIPIVITQRLGAAENAYYSLAWVMTVPLYLVSANTASSLVVSLVNERSRLREYAHRVFVQTARLVVPGALVLALAAPLFLRLFGQEYADQGTTTLRLVALSAIPAVVSALYISVWRVEQRLSLLVWVRCIQNASLVLLSLALLGPYGIRGPAIAWLVVQTAVAAVLLAVWPRVLVGDGSRPPRRLRGILLVRNAAADAGLLTLSQGIRRRQNVHRRLARAAIAVPRVLAELPENGAGPPPSAWTAHELPSSVTDKMVVLAGPPGARPRAAIKLAESEGAARALARETEVLGLLSGDPRLETWRALLPEVLAAGEIDGEPFLVERILPGVEASRLMAGGAASGTYLGLLAKGIESLHRLTGAELEVGPAIMAAWVDEPLAILELHARRNGGGEPWQLRALDRLRGELHGPLLGKRLTASWIHGDYVPGNVLIDAATGTVSGIIDWELAATPCLPALDLVQLVLAARALSRRREYGEIVVEALDGTWTEQEQAVLERTTEPLVGDPPLSTLVLFAWLRHTASMLTKAAGYGDNWLWQRSNLEAALAALA